MNEEKLRGKDMSKEKADLNYFQSKRMFPWIGKDFPLYEFMGLNDIVFLRVEDGLVTYKLPISRNHLNIHGTVHGGVLALCADWGCLMAVRGNMPLDSLNGFFTYTQNLRLDYIANTGTGYLFVTGRVIVRLRTFSLVESDIRDDDGTLLVRAVGQVFMGVRTNTE
jgi:acyl-coenzyme A thioesterase PaaI-like protein